MENFIDDTHLLHIFNIFNILFLGPVNQFMHALACVAEEVKFHFRLLTSAWAQKIKTTQELANSLTFKMFFFVFHKMQSKKVQAKAK